MISRRVVRGRTRLRVETEWGPAEGTPAEIAAFIRTMRELNASADAARSPDQRLILVPKIEDSPPPGGLANPPNNDLLLYEYANLPGLQEKTRRLYTRGVEEFEHVIAPKSFLDATVDDVRRFEKQLLEVCAHRKLTMFTGGLVTKGGAPQQRCEEGLYDWTLLRPTTCAPSCASFQRQKSMPRFRLIGLKSFYDWLMSRSLVDKNPVDAILREHHVDEDAGDDKHKISPHPTEVRDLLGAIREVGNLRDVAIILIHCKTGRRPSHVCRLHAEDLVDLHTPGLAHATFRGVKEIVKREQKGGKTKLGGVLRSVLDEETRLFLVDEYLPWRQERWGFAWNEGPLFPGNNQRNKPYREDSIQEFILDKAMRHLRDNASTPEGRDRWQAHLDDGSARLTPGCFRHGFTTWLEELGVNREDRKTLRGDKFQDALENYRHLPIQKLAAKYKMYNFLRDEPVRATRQAPIDGGGAW